MKPHLSGKLSYIGVAACMILSAIALPAAAQMVSGSRMPGFAEAFGVQLDRRTYPYTATLIESSAPGNILWLGEQPKFTIQLVNNTDSPMRMKAKMDLIRYGTRGHPGDIWKPDVVKLADVGSTPVDIDLPAKAFATLNVSPQVPLTLGAYALVADLGENGRQFVTTFVRTFAAKTERTQYPKFCLDLLPLDVLSRLGVQAVRVGVEYVPIGPREQAEKENVELRRKLDSLPRNDPQSKALQEQIAGNDRLVKDYTVQIQQLDKQLKALQEKNIAVLLMVGAGPASQPLGRPRPHLDDEGVMLNTKSDMAWLPENDADFQRWVAETATKYGWPRGPVNAFSLWNEPWEGISISGWGADMLRYRELYTRMYQGIDQARAAGAEVLVGGCDSSSNAQDKLFPDGSDDFLSHFDFLSIHYQGLDPHSTVKKWVDRKGYGGRVRIWDTESWVANTDDRVAATVASDRAAGYDRAMGVFGGNIAQEDNVLQRLPDGKNEKIKVVQSWPVAAAVGAAQHFLGEREFDQVLFKNGLPWVMLFKGLPGPDGKPMTEDGTIVVVGDLGEEFGHDGLLFRTAHGIQNVSLIAEAKRKLAALPPDAPSSARQEAETELQRAQVLAGATMTLDGGGGKFVPYDFYGNAVETEGGKIRIPLDGRGFFLRGNGAEGSFASLVEAARNARINGIEPVAPVCHDLLARIENHPALRISLTNILNRPVTGTLAVILGSLKLDPPSQTVTLNGNETKEVEFTVASGASAANNTYPLALTFDAGPDGRTVFSEDMHVTVIPRRTITVDGKLDDWKDVPPQIVTAGDSGAPSLTEAAWFPFQKFDQSVKKGFANGYLAYDDDFFYFAAKVADETPDAGLPRFETRDDDEYFYPPISYEVDDNVALEKKDETWPSDSDPRYLQKPDTSGGRVAAGWQSASKSFAIDLKLPEGELHQVAFYMQDSDDYDQGRRLDRIEILDPSTGQTLEKPREFTRFRHGKYAVYQLSGAVRVKVSSVNWLKASISGIFFDPAPSGADRAKDGKAKFVRIDEQTQGNWKSVYGSEGFNVIGATEHYPDYVRVEVPLIKRISKMQWPEGVRRFSYRKRYDAPSGNSPRHDNVQIAFNVLPPDQKSWYSCPPGTMPGFITYADTDYEYALNPVAEKYGGGVEIWRLAVPGMPHKHFFPRQPKSPFDGPVKNGKLVMNREGNTRIVEAALPWSELPDVRKRLDAGQTIKFSFRVNDNGSAGCMELSRDRSVAKRNGSFHDDWVEHWANEIEFAFEQSQLPAASNGRR